MDKNKGNKIAFFVEGQTEQIFINRLVRYLLSPKFTTIVQKKISGGSNAPKQEITIHRSLTSSPIFEVLIVNCGSDNRVKSELIDNMENLKKSGFDRIIGVRDLYPLDLDELPKLEKGMSYLPCNYEKKYRNYFDIILAIREVETWFLAEYSFFRKLNPSLTKRYILKNRGYDISKVDYLFFKHPAIEIGEILKLVGLSYTKKFYQVKKIVYSLNINDLMYNIRYKIPELDKLLTYIEIMRYGENKDKDIMKQYKELKNKDKLKDK